MSTAEPSASPRVQMPDGSRSAVPGNSSPGVTVAFLWQTLRRWWKLSTFIGLILAGVGGFVTWTFVEPGYRAAAWVRIEDHTPYLLVEQRGSAQFARTQVELMKSPLVLGQALITPDVAQLPEILEMESPLNWLAKNVTAKSVGNSELFQITCLCPRPEAAAKIVNAVLDGYLKVHAELSDSKTQRTVELLENEQKRRELDLERAQQNLRELAKQVTGKDATVFDSKLVVMHDPMIELEQRLTNAEVQREELDAKRQAMAEAISRREVKPSAADLDRAVEQMAPVRALRAQIAELQGRMQETERVAARGAEDPALIRVKADLAKAEEELKTVSNKLRDSVVDGLKESVLAERQAELEQLESQIASQRALERSLKERIATKQKELQNSGDHSLELQFARNELARSQAVHDQIAARATTLRTEMRAPARVSMLLRADPADVPLEKDPLKKLLGVVLGCFFLPFGLVIGWEHWARRIFSSQQLGQETEIPLLGEIAAMPTRALRPSRRRARYYEMQRNTFEESVNLLRTSLTLPETSRDVQVFAVASAVSGEGKTSLASQLAISLSQTCNAHVLIIDADLRAPDVHNNFQVNLTPGLVDVLSGRCALEEAVQKSCSPLVHVMSAGQLDCHPLGLMTVESLGGMLERLRASYRYILFDAPPVLSASEALVVARVADGVLLCTMRDHTRAVQLKRACEYLRTTGARVLGLVLSGVPSKDYAYHYGTYNYHQVDRDSDVG